MTSADFVVIGGGIAGISAAFRLSRHGRVIILEGEDALSYHSTGRSAALSHYGIGNSVVRGLTAYSRAFFQHRPERFSEAPVGEKAGALFVASADMLGELDELEGQMRLFTDDVRRCSEAQMRALCPVLKLGQGAIEAGLLDPHAIRLDANALVQGFARGARQNGGEVLTGERIAAIERAGSGWTVHTEKGSRFGAPIVVNAAGA